MKKGNNVVGGTKATGTKRLTRKEVEKQLRSGKLTKEQSIELRQKYMNSLEYKEGQQFVTCCGGIRPLPVLLSMEEED